jgi:hypothetical protein
MEEEERVIGREEEEEADKAEEMEEKEVADNHQQIACPRWRMTVLNTVPLFRGVPA